jgi:hypothetical protein
MTASLYNQIKFFSIAVFMFSLMMILHQFASAFHYQHCSKNILRVLLFKKSDVCIALHHVIITVETMLESSIVEILAKKILLKLPAP